MSVNELVSQKRWNRSENFTGSLVLKPYIYQEVKHRIKYSLSDIVSRFSNILIKVV